MAHQQLDGRLSEEDLNATYVPTSVFAQDAVIATAGAFPGLDPTAATDSTAALQAAVNATPDGARLIIPAGYYRQDGTLTITDRTITIENYGAFFRKSTDGAIISAAATVDTVYSVSSLTTITVSDENTDPGVRLTLSTNPGWTKGDIVQVIADDILPGVLPGNGTNEPRTGQFFLVHSTGANTVDLVGTLHDPMTTNIRVHRIRRHRVTIAGGDFNKTGTGTTIGLTRLASPVIRDASFNATAGQVIGVTGCVGWRVDNIVVDAAPNNPGSGIFGYGINNTCSAWGRASRMRIHRVRHAYTTADPMVPANSSAVHNYGRAFGNVCENSTAVGTNSTAWDTHSMSQGDMFVNCDAIDCYNGYGLRGRQHSIQGGKVIDCRYLFRIFSQTGSNSESWGHIIDGIHATRIYGDEEAMRIDLNPLSGVFEARKSTIRNITIDGVKGHVIQATNGTFDGDGWMVSGAPVRTANAAVFQLINSKARMGRVCMDQAAHTSGTGQRFAYMAGTSELDVAGGRWDFTTGSDFTRIVVRATGATDKVRIDSLEMSGKATMPYDSLYDANSFVDYTGPVSDARGSLVVTSREAIADATKLAPIAWTRSAVVQLQLFSNTNPYTLAALPSGRYRGQMLVMFVLGTSTQPITIPNDATKKILTKTAADMVLNAGATAQFVWNSTHWVQL
ncbi:glycoside hydrolase family 55 protein [Rhodococcus pyridinivorans]|uniref:glycoside hydrolase family 55 protein n=1 Tax=Rhodococcus pyridinivorans TaxID=103816 RepID=UPI001FFF1B84|nr:glycoside hydrolase family 55 protein [Rhodococcus pyridinivorans]UPK64906.1 glycoside hydrolase family 55 protein [Rhodococcus pyridinivorans]